MLSLLHIENIAVIERSDISFDGGFNVLTGETGAGKSIVIDAISALGLLKTAWNTTRRLSFNVRFIWMAKISAVSTERLLRFLFCGNWVCS